MSKGKKIALMVTMVLVLVAAAVLNVTLLTQKPNESDDEVVQTGFFALPVLWASVSIGLLSVNILLINNYRDMEEDAATGKNTTVVLFGRRFAANWYLINGLAAPLFTWDVWCSTPGWRTLLPIIYLASHIATYRALKQREGSALNPLLGRTAANLLLFTALLVVALIL